MAIIVGKEASINRLHKSLGYNKIHMNQMSKKQRNDVISNMRIDGTDITALCIKTNRDIGKIANRLNRRRKRISIRKIYYTYNHLLLSSIRNNIDKFLMAHDCHLNEIQIECDSDCIRFVKDAGLHNVEPGIAHELSDIVAWANSHSIQIPRVVELDRFDKNSTHVADRLKRKAVPTSAPGW